MSEKRKYSFLIRLRCGVLGALGIATLIFNFNNTEKIEILRIFSIIFMYSKRLKVE